MNIEIFGGSERVRYAEGVLSLADGEIENIKVLPIPTTRDGVRITGTEISLSDFEKTLEKGSFIIGYGLPESLKASLGIQGIEYYDAKDDEDFLVENAHITAIGALGYMLGTCKKIPADMKIGIIGYGRIGSALARMLLFFGARVKIFSSKKLTKIELGLFGVDTPEIDLEGYSFSSISSLDVIFNTAPTTLSYIFPEKRVPRGMRVIDLASGDSFPGVVGVEYLPSLPDRMYPESAGNAYAKHALFRIKDKEN